MILGLLLAMPPCQAIRIAPVLGEEASRRAAWVEPSPMLAGEGWELPLVGCCALEAPARTDELVSLDKWGAVAIAPDGLVLVQDDADASVHAFDAAGRERFVASPPSRLRGHSFLSIQVDAKGRIWVPRVFLDMRFDVYDASGEWLRTVVPPGADPERDAPWHVAFLPGAEGTWVHTASRVIERFEDDRALARIELPSHTGALRAVHLAAREDGGLVVTDTRAFLPNADMPLPEPPIDPDPRHALFVCDAGGRIRRRFVLPTAIEWSPFVVGGELVAFSTVSTSPGIVALLDLRTDRLHPARPAVEPERPVAWGIVCYEGALELWCVDRKARELLRFALP